MYGALAAFSAKIKAESIRVWKIINPKRAKVEMKNIEMFFEKVMRGGKIAKTIIKETKGIASL